MVVEKKVVYSDGGASVGVAVEEQGVLEDTGPYVGVGNAVLEVNARAILELNCKEIGT
jgi:hypothetical protein